jgi:hypothetical protein
MATLRDYLLARALSSPKPHPPRAQSASRVSPDRVLGRGFFTGLCGFWGYLLRSSLIRNLVVGSDLKIWIEARWAQGKFDLAQRSEFSLGFNVAAIPITGPA